MKTGLILLKIAAVLFTVFAIACAYWERVYKDGIFVFYQFTAGAALVLIILTIVQTEDVLRQEKH